MGDTPQDPRVLPLAALRLRRYETEHSADHLDAADFVDEVREDLALIDGIGRVLPQDLATLLRDTLAVLHIGQAELARRTGLSTKHINQIAQGKVSLTSTTALRLERATGVPALEWMRVQAAYQDGLIRRRPRVWWSDRDGVLEQMPGDGFRVIRVVTNVVLDELPVDAVELLPALSVSGDTPEDPRPTFERNPA